MFPELVLPCYLESIKLLLVTIKQIHWVYIYK